MRTKIELERAKQIAGEVTGRLSPYCRKIEVAGSIRRGRPLVGDIDLVLIPSDPWNLSLEIAGLGPVSHKGDKLKRVEYKGVQVDIYFADEATWATLLLIRTGSAENNIRLATRAKKRGWRLRANGDGLFNENGKRIAGDTEESIYQALGLAYQRPEGRG